MNTISREGAFDATIRREINANFAEIAAFTDQFDVHFQADSIGSALEFVK